MKVKNEAPELALPNTRANDEIIRFKGTNKLLVSGALNILYSTAL